MAMAFAALLPADGPAAQANEYVDEVLRSVQAYVQDNQMSKMALPDIHRDNLHMTAGSIGEINSMCRTGDISLDFDETTGAITVFGELGLSDCRIKYTYSGNRTVEILPDTPSIFIKTGLIIDVEPVTTCEELYFVSSGNIRYVYDWGSIVLNKWDEKHKYFIDKALQHIMYPDAAITAESSDDFDDWGDDISTESIIHFFFPFLHRNRKASIAARTTAINFSGAHVESIVDGWPNPPPPPPPPYFSFFLRFEG
ncbi:MAG: hypothetical protein LBS68_00095, partial [Puniceicoccales bacterium]|nr:hypothetical protein [Puniceicoccales bacterium]